MLLAPVAQPPSASFEIQGGALERKREDGAWPAKIASISREQRESFDASRVQGGSIQKAASGVEMPAAIGRVSRAT